MLRAQLILQTYLYQIFFSPVVEPQSLVLADASDSDSSVEISTPVKSAERNISPAHYVQSKKAENPFPAVNDTGDLTMEPSPRHHSTFSAISAGTESAQNEQSPEEDIEFKDLEDWLHECVEIT